MSTEKFASENGTSANESPKAGKAAASKTETGSDGAKAQQVDDRTAKQPAELSVSEIFAIMKDQTIRMKELRDRIASIRTKKAELKARKKAIQKALKGVGRFENKLNVMSKKSPLSPEDRLLLKAEKEFIKNELVVLDEEKFRRLAELKDLVGSNVKANKNQQTRNKAMSKSYIVRNRWSIESRLLKAINDVIDGENKERLEVLKALKKLIKENMSDDEILDFNNSLADFLDEVDPEIYVLCSHELKKPLYKAIRLTFDKWDAEKPTKIDKIVFPEESEVGDPVKKPEEKDMAKADKSETESADSEKPVGANTTDSVGSEKEQG